MRDEIDGRIWAEHGHAFSRDLASLFAAIRTSVGPALERLAEIEFDAPWKRDVRGPGQA